MMIEAGFTHAPRVFVLSLSVAAAARGDLDPSALHL
jgi:hypothetical protein